MYGFDRPRTYQLLSASKNFAPSAHTQNQVKVKRAHQQTIPFFLEVVGWLTVDTVRFGVNISGKNEFPKIVEHDHNHICVQTTKADDTSYMLDRKPDIVLVRWNRLSYMGMLTAFIPLTANPAKYISWNIDDKESE